MGRSHPTLREFREVPKYSPCRPLRNKYQRSTAPRTWAIPGIILQGHGTFAGLSETETDHSCPATSRPRQAHSDFSTKPVGSISTSGKPNDIQPSPAQPRPVKFDSPRPQSTRALGDVDVVPQSRKRPRHSLHDQSAQRHAASIYLQLPTTCELLSGDSRNRDDIRQIGTERSLSPANYCRLAAAAAAYIVRAPNTASDIAAKEVGAGSWKLV